MQEVRFLQLSKPKQNLIRLCQRVNYGSILNLGVHGGDVCLDTLPDVVIDVRLDGENTPRKELDLTDFVLPAEIRRLLSQIDALQDGVAEKIVVQDGIPRRVTFRASATEVSPWK